LTARTRPPWLEEGLSCPRQGCLRFGQRHIGAWQGGTAPGLACVLQAGNHPGDLHVAPCVDHNRGKAIVSIAVRHEFRQGPEMVKRLGIGKSIAIPDGPAMNDVPDG